MKVTAMVAIAIAAHLVLFGGCGESGQRGGNASNNSLSSDKKEIRQRLQSLESQIQDADSEQREAGAIQRLGSFLRQQSSQKMGPGGPRLRWSMRVVEAQTGEVVTANIPESKGPVRVTISVDWGKDPGPAEPIKEYEQLYELKFVTAQKESLGLFLLE